MQSLPRRAELAILPAALLRGACSDGSDNREPVMPTQGFSAVDVELETCAETPCIVELEGTVVSAAMLASETTVAKIPAWSATSSCRP